MTRSIVLAAIVALAAGRAAAQTGPAECGGYADNLDSCTPYACTFTHPFTGAPMERRIVGMRGDACSYVEQMPGGGSMACSYRADTRRAVAAFIRQTDAAQSTRTRARIDSQGGATTATTVDGKPVANPLDAALKSGECKVTGYGAGGPSASSPPSAPAPGNSRPAAASQPSDRAPGGSLASELPPGTTRGTLTLSGKPVELAYAYAFEAPNRSVQIVLSDVALTPAQARSTAEMEKLMRSRSLHAVAAMLDPASKGVTTMHVFDPVHQYAVFVAPSNRALDLDSGSAASLSGRLSTVRPGAFAGAAYEVTAIFNVKPQP